MSATDAFLLSSGCASWTNKLEGGEDFFVFEGQLYYFWNLTLGQFSAVFSRFVFGVERVSVPQNIHWCLIIIKFKLTWEYVEMSNDAIFDVKV